MVGKNMNLKSSLILASFCLLAIHATSGGQTTKATGTDPDVQKAIAAMRHIDGSKMTDADREAMGPRIEKAWETIARNGPAGIAALKAELRNVEQAKEKDDFFRLSAATLLWETVGTSDANMIAHIFQTTPLSTNYAYAFDTAFTAARTQDPNVLPILQATMKDEKMDFFVVEHAMHIVWPLTQEFIWGSYGSKGLPVLAGVLNESNSPTELKTAIDTLAYAQYLPALPAIRKLAHHEDAAVAAMAIQTLGKFGHPDDFEFLASGLKQKDSPLLFDFVFAAYEDADPRLVPLLIPLLANTNSKVAKEAAYTLRHIATVEAVTAVGDYAAAHSGQPQAAACQDAMDNFQKNAGISFQEFGRKSPQEKDNILADLRSAREKKYKLQPNDKRLTHDQFLQAAAEWKRNSRITGGQYAWVEDRHVADVATPEDLNLLYDVRAAVLTRLSNECLPEATILTDLIKRIGRKRYSSLAASMPVTSPAAVIPLDKNAK